MKMNVFKTAATTLALGFMVSTVQAEGLWSTPDTTKTTTETSTSTSSAPAAARETTTTESSTMETTSAPGKSASPTVLDQSSGTAQDIEVTRTIREELSSNDDLSTSAKNVEVITLNNTITLRGKVKSQAEKQQVGSVAKSSAGSRAIRNELTVDSTVR